MTRLKVLSIAFLAGLVVGCAVPSHAQSFEFGKTYKTVGVDSVEPSECSITLDGDEYTFDVCEDADHFEAGEIVALADSDGSLSVITDGGYEAELSQ